MVSIVDDFHPFKFQILNSLFLAQAVFHLFLEPLNKALTHLPPMLSRNARTREGSDNIFELSIRLNTIRRSNDLVAAIRLFYANLQMRVVPYEALGTVRVLGEQISRIGFKELPTITLCTLLG